VPRRVRLPAPSIVVAIAGVVAAATARNWPVRRTVGIEELTATGDHVVTTPAEASCRLPSASPPHGLFRDRTTDVCTRVTEQRLAIAGIVLVVTAIGTLVLVTLSKRRRAKAGSGARDIDRPRSERATAVAGRVMLVVGLIAGALGGVTLTVLESTVAHLHDDAAGALRGSPSAQVVTGLEIVGRPLGSDQTMPWRDELFIAVQPRVDASQPDAREALKTYLRDLGASTALVTKDFDDGWVDERGRIGADFIEFGTLEHFIDNGAPGLGDYEDAATALTARLGAESPSTFIIRIYPDPRLTNRDL
jgi:hypothetical protein